MKNLIFKTSNEIQIMKIIQDLSLQKVTIQKYTVDKERNMTTFVVQEKSTNIKESLNSNINEN